MSGVLLTIQSNANLKAISGDLYDPLGRSSMRLSDGSSQAEGPDGGIMLTAHQGISNVQSSDLGELVFSSVSCISDGSFVGQEAAGVNIEQVLLDGMEGAAMSSQLETAYLGEAGQALLDSLPQVGKGLAGDLTGSELSELIDAMQAQLLDLRSVSSDLFGELGQDIDAALLGMNTQPNEALFAAAQIDASELLDQTGGLTHTQTAGESSTLDGLFTHPEMVPLTMDFSNPQVADHSVELLASTSSSISSTASSTQVGLSDSSSDSSEPV